MREKQFREVCSTRRRRSGASSEGMSFQNFLRRDKKREQVNESFVGAKLGKFTRTDSENFSIADGTEGERAPGNCTSIRFTK